MGTLGPEGTTGAGILRGPSVWHTGQTSPLPRTEHASSAGSRETAFRFEEMFDGPDDERGKDNENAARGGGALLHHTAPHLGPHREGLLCRNEPSLPEEGMGNGGIRSDSREGPASCLPGWKMGRATSRLVEKGGIRQPLLGPLGARNKQRNLS